MLPPLPLRRDHQDAQHGALTCSSPMPRLRARVANAARAASISTATIAASTEVIFGWTRATHCVATEFARRKGASASERSAAVQTADANTLVGRATALTERRILTKVEIGRLASEARAPSLMAGHSRTYVAVYSAADLALLDTVAVAAKVAVTHRADAVPSA
ncbi:hypothetical protein FGB62_61g150 [Gracilaria domingensis]|nr:hypothetical protein FGB62_61g150 [Gracilaria domingensis]